MWRVNDRRDGTQVAHAVTGPGAPASTPFDHADRLPLVSWANKEGGGTGVMQMSSAGKAPSSDG